MKLYLLLKKRFLLFGLPALLFFMGLSYFVFHSFEFMIYLVFMFVVLMKRNEGDYIQFLRGFSVSDQVFWRKYLLNSVIGSLFFTSLVVLGCMPDRVDLLDQLQRFEISMISFIIVTFLFFFVFDFFLSFLLASIESGGQIKFKDQILTSLIFLVSIFAMASVFSWWPLIGCFLFLSALWTWPFWGSQFLKVVLPAKSRWSLLGAGFLVLASVALSLAIYDTSRFRRVDLTVDSLIEAKSIEQVFQNLSLLNRSKKHVPTEVVVKVFDQLFQFCPAQPRDNGLIIQCDGASERRMSFSLILPEYDIKAFLVSNNPYLQLLALQSMRSPQVIQDEEMMSRAALFAENRTLWTNVAMVTLEQPQVPPKSIEFSIIKRP